jgi:uncharacterized membrane protein YoaK (UPF0700 family)
MFLERGRTNRRKHKIVARKSDTSSSAFSGENEKAWLALLLAWIAGFSDAFGFVKLDEIFFSAVSGNTVAVNASLARRNWTEAAHRGCPIIFFAGGLVVGAIIEKMAGRLHIRRRFSITLFIEAALLLAFIFLGQLYFSSGQRPSQTSVKFYVLIALLSGAMGIQTGSLRRVGKESVSTPFVTGMLVKAIDNGANALFNAYDRLRNRKPGFPKDSLSKAILHGSLWLCFAIGAFCGGLGEVFWQFPALYAPITALVFIIACDMVRPICN